jgi:hypothetical protein
MVAQGCSNRAWMRAMHRIQNSEDINEFVQLWHMIRNTSLSDQEDKIIWGFTANRKYTAKSTYAVQFTEHLQIMSGTECGMPRLRRSANSFAGCFFRIRSGR